MILKARATYRNSLGHILFRERQTYRARRLDEENPKYCVIRNELHGETLIRVADIERDFEILDEDSIPYGPEDRDYGAACPWNAPGMRVSDFL